MEKSRILIIDDDELLSSTFNRALKQFGYDSEVCLDGNTAIDKIKNYNPDLILLDIYLGKVNGIHILEEVRKIGITTPVIIITAYSDVELAVKAVKLGAEDFVVKPIDIDHLELIVGRCISAKELKTEVNTLKEVLKAQFDLTDEKIIGKSEALMSVLNLAHSFSKSEDTTVLIEGESGTGKELIARFIHKNSTRYGGPFISVNCGAIPKDLAESELFGYEKGAFTGATEKMKQGKFELANKGTLLLDEIGELSLNMQVKLLRVLQDKKFYRLGGSKEITCDVRVIAATNKDLKKAVENSDFREDLFYRLNVAYLKIPPLYQRKEDVALLVESFIGEFNAKFNKSFKGIDSNALDILSKERWKGNVRELRNVIERIILIEDDVLIRRNHLEFLKGNSINISTDDDFVLKIPSAGINVNKVLKSLIVQTLEITGGNQVEAAKILGLTRSKLRYRMEKLNIISKPKIYY
jgi:two-component system, NtrC family, response regulator AtoC